MKNNFPGPKNVAFGLKKFVEFNIKYVSKLIIVSRVKIEIKLKQKVFVLMGHS
jgi:hypothetical protein